ncbi:c-type cytochrome biogenesis protein CcsB [Nocardioides dilutus]
MTDASWGDLSQQAIAAAGVVYFLALIAHLVEWSAFVGSRRAKVTVHVGAEAPASGRPDDLPAVDEHRVALFGRLGLLLTGLGAGLHLLGLVGRGMSADPDRVPWGNMYEFTISGTFVVALVYLVLYRRFSLAWMGPLVVATVVALLMVAVIWLYDPVGPLPDALDSPWLVIHVVSAILATGAFTVGGLISVVYLVKARRGGDGALLSRVPALEVLDRVAYRIHAFAFPVWTFAVLITGPIWAHQAWSSYWNWDPKEVWAFITWVVYAAYLHARTTAGWKGRNAAILALVGTATLWFNFIGINYFSSSSQHSYANAQSALLTGESSSPRDPTIRPS